VAAAAAALPPAAAPAAGDVVPSAGAGGSADTPVLMDGTSVGMQRLADSLAQTARTCSLDRMRDGPFARLAKENDILWSSGGRPDDITVVAVRLSTIPPKGPAPPNEQERLRSFAEGLQAESAADSVTTWWRNPSMVRRPGPAQLSPSCVEPPVPAVCCWCLRESERFHSDAPADAVRWSWGSTRGLLQGGLIHRAQLALQAPAPDTGTGCGCWPALHGRELQLISLSSPVRVAAPAARLSSSELRPVQAIGSDSPAEVESVELPKNTQGSDLASHCASLEDLHSCQQACSLAATPSRWMASKTLRLVASESTQADVPDSESMLKRLMRKAMKEKLPCILAAALFSASTAIAAAVLPCIEAPARPPGTVTDTGSSAGSCHSLRCLDAPWCLRPLFKYLCN